ncbi:MAG: ankyrin repeat domain-containing protein [Bdellovibrionia bacterium]
MGIVLFSSSSWSIQNPPIGKKLNSPRTSESGICLSASTTEQQVHAVSALTHRLETIVSIHDGNRPPAAATSVKPIDVLIHGKPIQMSALSSDDKGLTETYRIKFEGGTMGYFKPTYAEIRDNDHLHEIAAYKLDELLGFDLIPPTVKREIVYNGERITGSLQLHREGQQAYAAGIRTRSDKLLFLDFLIGNCDRHFANFLVRGSKEIAIDNGFAFDSSYCKLIASKPIYQADKARLALLPENPPVDLVKKLSGIPDSVFKETLSDLNDKEFAEFMDRKRKVLGRYGLKVRTPAGNEHQMHANFSPEPEAIIRSDLGTIKKWIASGVNLEKRNNEGRSALNLAVSAGNTNAVKVLLNANVDRNLPDYEKRTPLNEASLKGIPIIVKLLLDAGAAKEAADRDGATPLFNASAEGHSEIAHLLIERGADVNKATVEGHTPLMGAASHGDLKLVESLLLKGAQLDAKSKFEEDDALHQAAMHGHPNVAQFLLTQGAAVDSTNEVKYTAFHWAAHKNHPEVVKLLHSFKGNINARSKAGLTPLAVATTLDNRETVEVLLRSGADINLPDIQGWTPLNRAAYFGHLETIKALIKGGAAFLANKDGITPYEHALLRGDKQILDVLDKADPKAKTTARRRLKATAPPSDLD